MPLIFAGFLNEIVCFIDVYLSLDHENEFIMDFQGVDINNGSDRLDSLE